MNKVILLGNIARNLELKTTQNGMSYLNITIAHNRGKDKDGNDRGADFISCVAYGKTAESIAKYFEKGRKILIEGHIQTGSYEGKDGKKVYTTDVGIERFEFVDSKSSATQQTLKVETVDDDVATSDDDDLPF